MAGRFWRGVLRRSRYTEHLSARYLGKCLRHHIPPNWNAVGKSDAVGYGERIAVSSSSASSIGSPESAADYNEIKELGPKRVHVALLTRPSARFWTITGPQASIRSCASLPAHRDEPRARMPAHLLWWTGRCRLLHRCVRSEHAYNFWRPVTAIRNGDTDAQRRDRARCCLGAVRSTHPFILNIRVHTVSISARQEQGSRPNSEPGRIHCP